MSRIPEQFLDELLNRIDIVEIIDSRVKLRKTGKNYSACCPFHKEKTPSFSVSPDKQFYYCFGCGASGTALGFLIEYEHQGFLDAVDTLASIAGLTVPKEQTQFKQKSYKNLYTILDKSQQHYQDQLRQHPKRQEAVNYLKNRGLTGEIAKQYGVGYAAPGWDNLLSKLGLNDEDRRLLEDSGMTTVNEDSGKRYDRFRHRIMFPIIDVRGRTIGFGGRILASDSEPLKAEGKKRGAGPKYLNSPETDVFHKNRELYGLYQTLKSERKLEHLLIVEGYMDVIALAQFGINNAVATMGTACGEENLKLAFRYTNQIIFCFDGDNAGRKAAKRGLENALPAMIDGRQIKFLFLPEGQDPDTLVRQVGADRFREQLDDATPLETFFFESVSEAIDVRTMEGRARMSKLAAPLLNTLPSGIFRELMFDNLAQRTGLSIDILQELMKEKVKPSPKKPNTNKSPNTRSESALTPSTTTPSQAPHDTQSYEPPPIEVANYDFTPDFTQENPFQEESAHPHFQPNEPSFQRSSQLTNRVKLSPARLATTLLLEDPNLLCDGVDTQLPDIAQDQDLNQLKNLLTFLKNRPKTSFHTILGHWGGHYGIDAQKQLADLVADQFLGNAKRTSHYNSLRELSDALNRIRQEEQINRHSEELTKLADLTSRTDEQNKRLIELLQLKQQAKRVKQ